MTTNEPLSHRDMRSRIDRERASGARSNRLLGEKSPYLLQHAFNPVDWYPWGDEAFERARREEKVIFLSVGYSTCYWCHVMEREVFENDGIAALMNDRLVCIKVDREERPDIDQIYMSALVGMTGSGGWPMSVFMTPDREPFFAATYLPPVSRHGRPGFPEVVQRIAELWSQDRAKILESSKEIREYLVRSASPVPDPSEPGEELFERALASFEAGYDAANGGFGPAPKFPRPAVLNFLLRLSRRNGNTRSADMALSTLRAMARGGIHDHIGGGFHRYATDDRWHVPHFEKMLYDQAQLAMAYVEAYQFTRDEDFASVARTTLAYVQEVMTGPHGGFYSAEDAESAVDPARPDDRAEGAFYIWSIEELRRALDEKQLRLAGYVYGIEEQENVRHGDGAEFAGKNILYEAHTIDEAAAQFGLAPSDVKTVLTISRGALRDRRSQRPMPHLDDKVLASWNGLMISAFSRATHALGDESLLKSAERSAEFIRTHLTDGASGKLFRRYRDGEAGIDATLSDYACVVQGLLDLYEASFDIRWLTLAIRHTETQIALFFDDAQGGFFDTSESDKTLLVRTREAYDGAEPSGNSVAIMNLLRLSSMLGREQYRTMAMRTFQSFGGALRRHPHAVPQFLAALDFALSKPTQIVIAGRRDDPATQAMLKEVSKRFIPGKVVLLADGEEGQRTLASHVPFIADVKQIGGASTAYICENFACNMPTDDLIVLAEMLENRKPKRS